MKLSRVLLWSHRVQLELDVVLPRLCELCLKRSGGFTRHGWGLTEFFYGLTLSQVEAPQNALRPSGTGGCLGMYSTTGMVVVVRLPVAQLFTSIFFPVRCNYPSAVLYRLPETL